MVFAIVTIFALAVLLVLRSTWWRTPHEDDPIPPIPHPIDPVELAYLRRGPGDAVRAVTVGLAARGIVRNEGDLLATTGVPLPSRDDPFANAVYDGLRSPRTFATLTKAIEGPFRAALEPLDTRLREAGLLRRRVAPRLGTLGFVIIGPLGLIAAIWCTPFAIRDGLGAVALFLGSYVALMVVSLATLFRPRLTARGKRYLAQYRTGFSAESLRSTLVQERLATPPVASPVGLGGLGAGAAFAAPLLIGLYGVSALATTPYAGAVDAMRPPRRTAGSSGGCGGCGTGWGGGCGSCGGCGGSGCGSGCSSGGCGGCGGCGGGCGS